MDCAYLDEFIACLEEELDFHKPSHWDITQIENMLNMYKKKINSLDCQKTIPDCVQGAPCISNIVCETRSVKETDMHIDPRTEVQQAKDYLIQSLDDEMHRKIEQSYDTFNLRPNFINNGKELKEYVAKGWIVVAPSLKDEQDFEWNSPFNYILFQNPDKMPDQEGFDKAEKQIRKDVSEVKDQIVVFGAEKGLEALNAFKAKQYSK